MFQFDARTVAPALGFEPWPEGWNPLVIRSSNMKPTSKGDGGYLELKVEAIDGPNKGRTNFIRLNIYNPNPQAVDISLKQLSAICHVVGVFNISANPDAPEDMAAPMLHNIPFQARCVLNTNKETGQSSNNFVAFKDAHGNEPGKQGQAAQQQPQQQTFTQAVPQQQAAPSWQQPAQQPWPGAQQAPPQQAPQQQPQQAPQAAPQQSWPPQQPPQAQPSQQPAQGQPAGTWQQAPNAPGAQIAPWQRTT